MGSHHITVKRAEELNEADLKAYGDLNKVVWPHNPCAAPKEIMPEDAASRPERILAFVKEEGAIISGAEGFALKIFPQNGRPMTVLALASVCTHPDYRHKGLGERMVKAVLKRVDDGEFPVALWQTGVPDFYQRLGAKAVGNRFVNTAHPTDKGKTPFWDKVIMIYPAGASWPDGVIDIKALGY